MTFAQLVNAAIAPARAITLPGTVIPDRLRALVRGSEIALILLAAFIGCAAGLLVSGIGALTDLLHRLLYQLDPGDRLSAVDAIDPRLALIVPVAGGLLIGAMGYLVSRYHKRRIVDPIEANALQGGQMSVRDSVIVTVQTIVSNGFGASVGLEAGYTQIVAGVASRLGIAFRLRRADLRVLVGCGAASAIAAAFGAPLTGAFYGFELIIGAYTAASLGPVLTASIAGVIVARIVGGPPYTIVAGTLPPLANSDLPNFLLLAIACAGLGIGVMRAVTLVELFFRRLRLPTVLRPALGGLVVGGLAIINPHVLSSGHGALYLTFQAGAIALLPILVLLVLKVAASAISLGSGFRGGLFFASLFIGALTGQLYAGVMAAVLPAIAPDPLIATIIGMSSTAVAIVGGPLTMSFLALETTGDLAITLAVLAASVVSSATVRELFGYSFATWRLHLRGESIRSAHDVGRIRALTVGRLMRRDVRTVRIDTRVSAVRRDFPLGSTQRVVVVDIDDAYAGIALVPEIHALELSGGDTDQRTIGEFLHYRDTVLEPQMNIKDAMRHFDEAESDALAVVDSPTERHVIGLLTEAHALRRYSEELDRARRDLVGEGD